MQLAIPQPPSLYFPYETATASLSNSYDGERILAECTWDPQLELDPSNRVSSSGDES